jgi:hypothetical protein
MELPIELNNVSKTESVIYAGQQDFGFLTDWRDKVGDDQNPYRTETLALTA